MDLDFLTAFTADFTALRLTLPVLAELLTVRRVLPAADAAAAEVWRLGDLVCDRALPAAVRAWDPLEAFLTTFEDLLAAALPVTFGFVTSSYLSNLTAILEQPDGPQASLLQRVSQAAAFQRCP